MSRFGGGGFSGGGFGGGSFGGGKGIGGAKPGGTISVKQKGEDSGATRSIEVKKEKYHQIPEKKNETNRIEEQKKKHKP